MALAPLTARLGQAGPDPDGDVLLDTFVEWVNEGGIELYPAQEEAILEILSGANVIVNTPTGSGKSLVALAAHFAGLATGRRSYYTAPIKALVSEKFFALCRDFGTESVGMITGDGSVNASAPIICCTAEILANLALRDGADADAEIVIMDEFHYYSEPDRGWAWQVPLLELTNAQFVLMSATLGDTEFFIDELNERTGRPSTLVTSATRPVPLNYEYRETPLHESIEELLETNRAPIYVVYFTQREATEAAQSFMSINVLSKQEKADVNDLIGHFRFDSPIGKDLQRWLKHGIGVHHAGLLPKYRLLVEKLAQAGLLKLICGTDTLGVGVNVPIRTVLFTQLFKYDGSKVRVLRVREFQQIAGRAGRKGYDDVGHVWAQAPPHEIENARNEAKAAHDPKKQKKLVKKKPPDRGYAHWSNDTFTKLIESDPEPLVSRFSVSHHLLMNLLDRPADETGRDGLDAAKKLLTDNHEARPKQRDHIRRAIGMYRSLLDAGVVERLDRRDDLGRRVRVMIDLQEDFALTHPLSLFAVEAIEALEGDSDPYEHAVDVVSVIESVLETPRVIIAAQLNHARAELVNELKAQGVEYEERMERLEALEPARPLGEFLYPAFDVFRQNHPWVGGEAVEPKSIARDLWERAMTFREFVQFYGLKRSEGVVLRYLSDVYKGLVQNVPDDHKTEQVDEFTEWLGDLVRGVDSSLIDEWEALTNPPDESNEEKIEEPFDITRNTRAFTVMVRNGAFRWVLDAARNFTDTDGRNDADRYDTDDRYDNAEALRESLAPYWDEFDSIDTGPAARRPDFFFYDRPSGAVTQIIGDPEETGEWQLHGSVDLEASRQRGECVITLERVTRHDGTVAADGPDSLPAPKRSLR